MSTFWACLHFWVFETILRPTVNVMRLEPTHPTLLEPSLSRLIAAQDTGLFAKHNTLEAQSNLERIERRTRHAPGSNFCALRWARKVESL